MASSPDADCGEGIAEGPAVIVNHVSLHLGFWGFVRVSFLVGAHVFGIDRIRARRLKRVDPTGELAPGTSAPRTGKPQNRESLCRICSRIGGGELDNRPSSRTLISCQPGLYKVAENQNMRSTLELQSSI